MKKIFAVTFFISAMCGFVFAQTLSAELEKVRRIKFLESTGEDVKKILSNYKPANDKFYRFSGANADIEISYTDGDCSDEDSDEIWNVPEGKVKYIEISPDDSDDLTLETFGFNKSNFQKEQEYANVEDQFIYHNKDFGVAFRVSGGEVETIFLFPSNSFRSMLCDNDAAKEFYSSKSWFREKNLENREFYTEGYSPNLDSLQLSANEIIIGCNNSEKKTGCAFAEYKISVTTSATDPENDVLIYKYNVSGGKIVGEGANVVWDLYGVKPGTYTITAGVDDGCGICSQPKTQTVTVKECTDCSVKDN